MLFKHKISKVYTPKKEVPKETHNWFEKHQGIWTFGATIISALALLVSIYVMLDQKKASNDNLQLVKEQLDLAKAQFDTANSDRIQSAKEIAEKFKYQDSINKIQLAISSGNLEIQEYANKVQIENGKPHINIDSIWFSNKRNPVFSVKNIGARPLDLNKAILCVYNTRHQYLINDTINAPVTLAQSQNITFVFEKAILDSISEDTDYTMYYLKIFYKDVILNKIDLFRVILNFSDHITDGLNISYISQSNQKAIDIVEKLIRTKNWKAYFTQVRSKY